MWLYFCIVIERVIMAWRLQCSSSVASLAAADLGQARGAVAGQSRRQLKDGYLSVDAEEAGRGGGDIAFEDVVLDDFVVDERVDVVVEGGGDFNHDGVDAGMQEGGCIGVNLFAVPLHTAAGAVDDKFADVINLSEVEYGVGADAVEGDLRGVGDGSGEVFELLCFAEVAESLHDGVACPALDSMVERDVPLGVDGEVFLPFVVVGSPLLELRVES